MIDKDCLCELLGKQTINATEGSYTTSIDFFCPVHGMKHLNFPKPKGWDYEPIPKLELTWD